MGYVTPPEATYVVGASAGNSDYRTIMEALQADAANDVVVYVRNDQVYNEMVLHEGLTGITLVGHPDNPVVNGSTKAVIDGQGTQARGIDNNEGWTIRDFWVKDVTDRAIGDNWGGTYANVLIEDVWASDCSSWAFSGDSTSTIRRCIAVDCRYGFDGAARKESCVAVRCWGWISFRSGITINCNALECVAGNDAFSGCTPAVNCYAEAADGVTASKAFAGMNEAHYNCHAHGSWTAITDGSNYDAYGLTTSTGTLPTFIDRAAYDFTIPVDSPLAGKGRVVDILDLEYLNHGLSNFTSSSASFDADGEYLKVAPPASMQGTDYTISFWFRMQPGDSQWLYVRTDSGGEWVERASQWAGYWRHRFDGVGQTDTVAHQDKRVSSEMMYEFWHMVTVSHDIGTNETKIYLDGDLLDTNTVASAVPISSGDEYYFLHTPDPDGGDTTPNTRGFLSGVTFWDSVLTGGDISDLWNYGTPNDATTHRAVSSLKAYYKLSGDLTDVGGGSPMVSNGVTFDGPGTRSQYDKGAATILGGGGQGGLFGTDHEVHGRFLPQSGTVEFQNDGDGWNSVSVTGSGTHSAMTTELPPSGAVDLRYEHPRRGTVTKIGVSRRP